MSKRKVIGIKETNFTPADSDRPIVGKKLFCIYQDNSVTGFACESVFVTPTKFLNGVVPKVEDMVDISYNRYGKVESVAVL